MAITNDTELANFALQLINAGSISSIDGNGREATILRSKLTLATKRVISEGEFHTTKRRANLTLRTDLSRPDFQYCYYVPDDYVKGYALESGYIYEMESGAIFSDDDSPRLIYFANLQNYNMYGPIIPEVMGCLLAVLVCMEIKGDSNMLALAESEYMKYMRSAKAHDRSEKNGQKKNPTTWSSFNEGTL